VRHRQGHGEGRVHGTGVTFRDRHVVDGNVRFVVEDGAHARAVGKGRVGRGAEVDGEGLVRLSEAVAVDQYGDRSAGLAWGNRQRAGRGLVVAAGRGGAVGGGVVDRHGLVARGQTRHGKDEGGRAVVAFANGYVADGQPRQPVEGIRPRDVGVDVREVVDGV